MSRNAWIAAMLATLVLLPEAEAQEQTNGIERYKEALEQLDYAAYQTDAGNIEMILILIRYHS